MGHEYLQRLFKEKKNFPYPYNLEDSNDFDERETYSFDYTMIAWLYEHLKFFQEEASKVINFDFHTFTIDEETLTQAECIDRMIKDCEFYLKFGDKIYGLSKDEEKKIDKAVNDLFKVLSIVFWSMWW